MEQAAKEKGTQIIGSYTDRCGTDPLYVGYSITGVGYLIEYAIEQTVAGTWKPGYKPFGLAMGPKASGMVICRRDARAEGQARGDQEGHPRRQDQGARRLKAVLVETVPRPADAGAALGGAAAVAARHVEALRQPAGARRTSRSTSRAGESIACSARTAPASRRCATSSSASTEPDAGEMRFDGAAARACRPGRGAGAGHRHGPPAFQPGAAT